MISNLRAIGKLLRARPLPRWDLDILDALHVSKRELLRVLGQTIGPVSESLPALEDIVVLDPLAEADEDQFLSHFVEAFGTMMESGWYTLSADTARSMARALTLMSFGIKVVAQQVLCNALMRDDWDDVSGQNAMRMLLDANCGAPMLKLLADPWEKGLPVESLEWWVVFWLAGAVRDNAGWLAQIGAEQVASLFNSVMPRLADAKRSGECLKVDEFDGWMKSMGALFLEVWSASSKAGSGNALAWTSPETVKAFLFYIAAVEGSRFLLDILLFRELRGEGHDVFDLPIRHEHTFHYIEHTIQTAPWIAVECGLDVGCASFIDQYAFGDRIYDAVKGRVEVGKEVREGARRARAAQERLTALVRRDVLVPSVAWQGHPCETCRIAQAS